MTVRSNHIYDTHLYMCMRRILAACLIVNIGEKYVYLLFGFFSNTFHTVCKCMDSGVSFKKMLFTILKQKPKMYRKR